MEASNNHLTYLLRIADSNLIIGQRMSEWCGHGPVLEEDIAMANIALDLIGQSRILFQHIGKLEGKGRSEDDLAFLRDGFNFYSYLLCERPNGDFAHTITRQFFYAAFCSLFYRELMQSSDKDLAAFAEKSLKEVRYHLKHTGNWMIRMGDGTEESHQRAQSAIDALWTYTGEMFHMDEIDRQMLDQKIGVDTSSLKGEWLEIVRKYLSEATLTCPDPNAYMHIGGKNGKHSEHLGHILAEMQFLQRAYPGAEW